MFFNSIKEINRLKLFWLFLKSPRAFCVSLNTCVVQLPFSNSLILVFFFNFELRYKTLSESFFDQTAKYSFILKMSVWLLKCCKIEIFIIYFIFVLYKVLFWLYTLYSCYMFYHIFIIYLFVHYMFLNFVIHFHFHIMWF